MMTGRSFDLMGKKSKPVAVQLPEVLDRMTAKQVADMLIPSITKAATIEIGGTDVRQIGQVGLQLLLSAKRTALECGADVTIRDPSDALSTVIALAGLETELLAASAAN